MSDTSRDITASSDAMIEAPSGQIRSRFAEFWGLFRRNSLAVSGLAIFTAFFLTAVAGLLVTSGTQPLLDPAQVRLQEKLRPPLSQPNLETLRSEEIPTLGVYLFGTDNLGRDVFARMLQGAWVSLTVGFVAVGISVIIGILLGGIAGYFGEVPIRVDHMIPAFLFPMGLIAAVAGEKAVSMFLIGLGAGVVILSVAANRKSFSNRRPALFSLLRAPLLTVDALIMRLVDIMLCFPSFFLILTVVALLPASLYNIMIVIGLTSWMGTTRFVRAEFLSLREQDFVVAARALGVNTYRIIFRHMMPNAIAPVLVSSTIGIATAILTEAGLSFLGFGVPPPHATWGNILSGGKDFIFDAPWLTFVPGIAILIVVLSFNLFGEGLRDALNPKLRERH